MTSARAFAESRVVSTTFAIIAKAGGSEEAAENTCEAVSSAIRLELPGSLRIVLEIDLRLSADAALIALHDATLDRTTDGRGLVRRFDAAKLCSLRAGPHGQRVPLLDEIIDVAELHELVLELHDSDLAVADALARALRRRTAAERESVIVASEHTCVIRAYRALSPPTRSAATVREAWRKLLLGRVGLERLAPRGHPWIVPGRHRGFEVVTARFAESAAAAGDDVWVFAVAELAELMRLRALGVTGTFTTRPAALVSRLEQHAVRMQNSPGFLQHEF